jgi:DNA-binding GntR family transcriptional regulator
MAADGLDGSCRGIVVEYSPVMPRPRKPRVDLDVAFSSSSPGRSELWEGVADTLREAILLGSLPAGSSLIEADLAQRFDVSRGPVRDALRDLARAGLVVDIPRRGTVVSTLSFTDIQEIYEVREGLEVTAVRLVVERATDAELASLVDRISDLEATWERDADYSESLAADLAFHGEVIRLSANDRLIRIYQEMIEQTRLTAVSAATVNPDLRRAMRRPPHRQIIKALRARDVDAATKAVVNHYEYARERLLIGEPERR